MGNRHERPTKINQAAWDDDPGGSRADWARYKRSDGSFGVYSSPAVEEAVAKLLVATSPSKFGVTSRKRLYGG